jgi:hypothetical protein
MIFWVICLEYNTSFSYVMRFCYFPTDGQQKPNFEPYKFIDGYHYYYYIYIYVCNGIRGRGLCDGWSLVQRSPTDSGVSKVCDRETSKNEEA